MKSLPFAEDVNFWKTGKSGADTWIDRTKKQIEILGGKVESEAFGMADGKAAFMIAFSISADRFKIIWPVLPSERGDEKAAKIQAATMLYHYVKSVSLRALVVGPRQAFFSHFLIEGKMASELSGQELINLSPKFLIDQ